MDNRSYTIQKKVKYTEAYLRPHFYQTNSRDLLDKPMALPDVSYYSVEV